MKTIRVEPGENVEQVIERAPEGTEIIFKSGKYSSINPKIVRNNIHLVGEDGTEVQKSRFDFRGDNGSVRNLEFVGNCSINALFESSRDFRRIAQGLTVLDCIFRDYNGYAKRIRVASSHTHFPISAHCTIRNCLFMNIEGRNNQGKRGGELISVKAGNCSLLNNTFKSCEGRLSIRGGQGSTVAYNLFEDMGRSSGIQVYDENHMVIGNDLDSRSELRVGDGDARDVSAARRGGPNHIAAHFAQIVENVGKGRIVIQRRYRRYRPENVHLVNNDMQVRDEWS